MIDDGRDDLSMLVWHAINDFPLHVVYDLARSRDAVVRTKAARRLQLDKEHRARTFKFAVELTNARRAYEREIAAFLLGQLDPPDYPCKTESVPILERLVRDPYPSVRARALEALAFLKGSNLHTLAIEALEEDNPEVIFAAAFALWNLGLHKRYADRVRRASKNFSKRQRDDIQTYLED